jgi:beta-galactosidase
MHRYFMFVASLLLIAASTLQAQSARSVIDLNGVWQFDQTELATPPEQFTRTCPVPGLIDLAEPPIEQMDELFAGTQQLRYSWYKRTFQVSPDQRSKIAFLTLRKSMYVTQITLNGYDVGTWIETTTPIDANITDYLHYDGDNELIIRIGDRARLPVESAHGADFEKVTDIPGIWDDVFVTFSGELRIHRILMLPDADNESVTAKVIIDNHFPIERGDQHSMEEPVGSLTVYIREKVSQKRVTETMEAPIIFRDRQPAEVVIDLPMKKARLWSPENPFLYEAVVTAQYEGSALDEAVRHFGQRDFGTEGRMFTLNGQQYPLLGSTVNFFRFLEDHDRQGLPWDREWVRKMFIDIPKSLHWNSFRICIGLVPDFWYDLADEHGILLQNEWPQWFLRGRNAQIEKEYTDWVWTDGSHPSIVIWDAMNEAKQSFVGNTLVPKLKQLDPTRIWDIAYMSGDELQDKDMDEPHYYPLIIGRNSGARLLESRRLAYRFGSLSMKHDRLSDAHFWAHPMSVNEYGWMWLQRDGDPAYLSETRATEKGLPGNYSYYLGAGAGTVKQRRELQAYVAQLQTERIRSTRDFAGVISFCYLSNSPAFTGDWFIDNIKDLKPAPTLNWFEHAFRPAAVFIDCEDGRYLKEPKIFQPGQYTGINLRGVNDTQQDVTGSVTLKILDADGRTITEQSSPVAIPSLWYQNIPLAMPLPEQSGNYLLLSEYQQDGVSGPPQISRRYIRIGHANSDKYYDMPIGLPASWPKKQTAE